MTAFRDPPQFAAWRHREAREGFEVVFISQRESGHRLEGSTSAVEEGKAWAVRYEISLDSGWRTRGGRVWGRSADGERGVALEADDGHWRVDGRPAPELDGCLDLDLESSACTNAFPVHRLSLEVGEQVEAPAAYVRALDLRVERLEQRYRRLDDDGGRRRYHYESPRFGFECELAYDEHGLVLEYPGIAVRAA